MSLSSTVTMFSTPALLYLYALILSQFAPTLIIHKLLIQYMVRPFLLPTTILLPVSALLFPNLPSCSIKTHALFSVHPALTALVFFLYKHPDCLLPHYQFLWPPNQHLIPVFSSLHKLARQCPRLRAESCQMTMKLRMSLAEAGSR